VTPSSHTPDDSAVRAPARTQERPMSRSDVAGSPSIASGHHPPPRASQESVMFHPLSRPESGLINGPECDTNADARQRRAHQPQQRRRTRSPRRDRSPPCRSPRRPGRPILHSRAAKHDECPGDGLLNLEMGVRMTNWLSLTDCGERDRSSVPASGHSGSSRGVSTSVSKAPYRVDHGSGTHRDPGGQEDTGPRVPREGGPAEV